LVTNPREEDEIIEPWEIYQPGFIVAVSTIYQNLLNSPRFCKMDFESFGKLTSGAGGMPL
jgi:hypothetical protein